MLEIGVGAGNLTRVIAEFVPQSRITGIELDESLLPHDLPDCRFLLGDAREFDYTTVLDGKPHLLIANAPYSLLDFIRQCVLTRPEIVGAVLMIPERRMTDFAGWCMRFGLPGTEFDPPATGWHLVVEKGLPLSR